MRLILGTPSFLGRGKLQTQTRRALSLQAVSQDSGTRRPHNCATFLCHCGAPLIPRWTPTHTHTHTPRLGLMTATGSHPDRLEVACCMGTSPQQGLLASCSRAGPSLGVWPSRGFKDLWLSLPPGPPPSGPWPGLPVAPLPAGPRCLVLPRLACPRSLSSLPGCRAVSAAC